MQHPQLAVSNRKARRKLATSSLAGGEEVSQNASRKDYSQGFPQLCGKRPILKVKL